MRKLGAKFCVRLNKQVAGANTGHKSIAGGDIQICKGMVHTKLAT